VPGDRLRLEAYRKIAEIGSEEMLEAVRAELLDRYGPMPEVVSNLLEVARFRCWRAAPGSPRCRRRATSSGSGRWTCRTPGACGSSRLYPGSTVKAAVRTVLVPRPTTARIGGQPLRDTDVLRWASEFVEAILLARSQPRQPLARAERLARRGSRARRTVGRTARLHPICVGCRKRECMPPTGANPRSPKESTMRIFRTLGVLVAGAGLAGGLVATPRRRPRRTPPRTGDRSLAALLTADGNRFDRNGRDYDVVTEAVLAVLAAKPSSPVGVLADGSVPLTAFLPDDRAFRLLVKDLTGRWVVRESAVFAAVAGSASTRSRPCCCTTWSPARRSRSGRRCGRRRPADDGAGRHDRRPRAVPPVPARRPARRRPRRREPRRPPVRPQPGQRADRARHHARPAAGGSLTAGLVRRAGTGETSRPARFGARSVPSPRIAARARIACRAQQAPSRAHVRAPGRARRLSSRSEMGST
jgi:hypothetical protein